MGSCCDTIIEGARKLAHGAMGLGKVAAQEIGLRVDLPEQATIAARREICRACDEARKTEGRLTAISTCSLCDCLIGAKTRVASEACPAGKWLAAPARSSYAYPQEETIATIMATAGEGVKRADRMGVCSQCPLCEAGADGARPWSKCRAVQRRRLKDFIDNPLAACPAGHWHAEYPMLDWAPATQEVGIVIGSDDQAAWLVPLFVRYLRKQTGCTWPIYCADYGLSANVAATLPVDGIVQVPGKGLHPMYRKPAAALVAPFRRGVWYDTDILVRVSPALAVQELEKSGRDLAVRRGELWWQIKHRGDNWHTGVFAYRHGSEALRHWASWSLAGDAAWVTAADPHHIRDEELFAELIRTRRLPIHELSPRHSRLPSEFDAARFGMPPMDCSGENWHFPGTPAKQQFKHLAEAELAGT